MIRSRLIVGLLLALCLFQPACIWKLWSKDEPPEERIHDVYGTVESVSKTSLVIRAKRGKLEFALLDSSIKGSDFDAGAYVHVYYKIQGEANVVTMVVEKVDY